MKGTTFRRCGCRDPQTGRKYPDGKCPRLHSKKRADQDHGSWWGRYEAPAGPDGKRRQPRIGPFETKDEVEDALAVERARLGSGAQPTDRKILVKEYLSQWLQGKRSLKKDTWDSYEEAIRLYFIPAYGHIKLWQLRKKHIDDLVTALG
jgi:hypothetical protein